MAVSPLLVTSKVNATAVKAKALVVASSINGAKSERTTNGGLAELVNKDEKQRWVKGWPLEMHRQWRSD